MPLRQTTLVLGKRLPEQDERPAKKRALATEVGTSAFSPIVLDASRKPVRAEQEEGTPTTLGLDLAQSSTPRHEGPTQAQPTCINPATFSLSTVLSSTTPRTIHQDPDLDLLFFRTFVRGRQLYEYLLRELPWYRVVYEIRGTSIRTPRWTCVWGCDDTSALPIAYDIAPRTIPAVLVELKGHVEKATGARFNFCLGGSCPFNQCASPADGRPNSELLRERERLDQLAL